VLHDLVEDHVRDVEPRTLAGLFAVEYQSMVRLALLLTGSNEVAEDLVQDAFVRVQRNWDRIEQPGAYLRVVVVNRCRTWRGHRRRERPLRASDGLSSDAAYREMIDALARVPPRRRAALVLRYYEDRSEAEIAQILGCRPGTVKSLLHRGLAQLRVEIPR